MPRKELNSQYVTANYYYPFDTDRFTWLGSPNVSIDPLVNRNLAYGVAYSPNKRKRWELFDELVRFVQSRDPDPSSLLLVDEVDAIKKQRSNKCVASETQVDRLGSRRAVRFGVNFKSYLYERKNEATQMRSKLTDQNDKYRKRDQRCSRRKQHHRPPGHDRKNTSDITAELAKPKLAVSAVIFEQAKQIKRSEFFYYRRRHLLYNLVPSKRKALSQYVLEVNKADSICLLDEDNPTEYDEFYTLSDPTGRLESDDVVANADRTRSWTTDDETSEMTDGNSVNENRSDVAQNRFLNKNNHVITFPIPVLVDNWPLTPSAHSNVQTVSIGKDDSVICLRMWCSLGQPNTYAIDLTPLIEKAETETQHSRSLKPAALRNVAYLLLVEQASPKNKLSTAKQFSAQLQIAMGRNCQLIIKIPNHNSSLYPPAEAISLDRLVEQAADAVNRIPNTAINWIACQPYRNYHILDASNEVVLCKSHEEESRIDQCDDDVESSFVVIQRTEVNTVQETRERTCALHDHCIFDDPVELCANQHYACLSCLRPHLDVKLNAVCCGVSDSEVCWMCPQSGCPAPLSRLAQLQAAPLQRLAPVWKCADFLNAQLDHGSSRRPVFYANPQCNPQAVLTVWTEAMCSIPSRPTSVIFQPSTDVTRCWPRLYFYPKCTTDIHWPASCLAAQKYWRLREHLGDLQYISGTLPPDTSCMQPVRLPMPGGERNRFYCEALMMAWRRNAVQRRYVSNKNFWSDCILKDKLSRSIIDKQVFLSWIETLLEIQSILEYVFIQKKFGSVKKKGIKFLIESLQRMECQLGEHLSVYPITANVTINLIEQKQKKYKGEKKDKTLPVDEIKDCIMSFERLKPLISELCS